MRKIEIPIGTKYGSLTVIGEDPVRGKCGIRYFCSCKCGNTISAYGRNLRYGKQHSCGCIDPDIIKEQDKLDRYYKLRGFEGLYEISKTGKIRTLRNEHGRGGKILKPYIDRDGYSRVALYRMDGSRVWIGVHKAVADTFIENPRGCEMVNHKNYNRSDNRVENLEWVTPKENVEWSIEHYRGTNFKPVVGVSTDGALKWYPSISSAARDVGSFPGNIIRAIKNGGKCAELRWQYAS